MSEVLERDKIPEREVILPSPMMYAIKKEGKADFKYKAKGGDRDHEKALMLHNLGNVRDVSIEPGTRIRSTTHRIPTGLEVSDIYDLADSNYAWHHKLRKAILNISEMVRNTGVLTTERLMTIPTVFWAYTLTLYCSYESPASATYPSSSMMS